MKVYRKSFLISSWNQVWESLLLITQFLCLTTLSEVIKSFLKFKNCRLFLNQEEGCKDMRTHEKSSPRWQPRKILILKKKKKESIMKQDKHLQYYYFLCRCIHPYKQHFEKECKILQYCLNTTLAKQFDLSIFVSYLSKFSHHLFLMKLFGCI